MGTTRNHNRVVSVSEKTIATAERADSRHCMIADAIRESFPDQDLSGVSVDLQTIRWSDRKRGERITFLTPPMAQDALIDFDQGITNEPFEFRLGTPIHVAPMRASSKADGERLGRPNSVGPVTVDPGPKSRQQQPIIRGGKTPPVATLSHKKGAERRFGQRNAGKRRATDTAVAGFPETWAAEGRPGEKG
jgi:hypothetical protein